MKEFKVYASSGFGNIKHFHPVFTFTQPKLVSQKEGNFEILFRTLRRDLGELKLYNGQWGDDSLSIKFSFDKFISWRWTNFTADSNKLFNLTYWNQNPFNVLTFCINFLVFPELVRALQKSFVNWKKRTFLISPVGI